MLDGQEEVRKQTDGQNRTNLRVKERSGSRGVERSKRVKNHEKQEEEDIKYK